MSLVLPDTIAKVQMMPVETFPKTSFGKPLAEKLAATEPRLLACMHGASWEGDGGPLLRALGDVLG